MADTDYYDKKQFTLAEQLHYREAFNLCVPETVIFRYQ